MFVITTRSFLPDIGGIETLMTELSYNLSKHGPVKVYAEDKPNAKAFDQKQKYEIERIKGFKFIRKFRKANQIHDFFNKNKGIAALISDHWKSLEKLSKNNFCSFLIIFPELSYRLFQVPEKLVGSCFFLQKVRT
mgnify:CR=1 FL=1